MTKEEIALKHQKICDGVGVAISKGLDCDRRLGESIAVWQDGKVVIFVSRPDTYPRSRNDLKNLEAIAQYAIPHQKPTTANQEIHYI